MTIHPAFFRHIVRAKLNEQASQQTRGATAHKLRALARQEIEAARAVTGDPEFLRQLLAWQRRLERRGRKRKPAAAEARFVPMFAEEPQPETTP